MELETLNKLFEESEQDAVQLASQALAGVMSEPSFLKTIEDSNRFLAEQISKLNCIPDFKLTSDVSASVQKMLAETTQSLFRPNQDLGRHLASLVPSFNSDLGGVQDFLKRENERQRKANERFLESLTTPIHRLEQSEWLNHQVQPPLSAPFHVADTVETDVEQFLRQCQKHLDDAKEIAAESNGRVVVTCKSPSGDRLRGQFSLSSEDGYFIKVSGFDEFQQSREWVGTPRSLDIAIEVLPLDEDDVESVEEDLGPIN